MGHLLEIGVVFLESLGLWKWSSGAWSVVPANGGSSESCDWSHEKLAKRRAYPGRPFHLQRSILGSAPTKFTLETKFGYLTEKALFISCERQFGCTDSFFLMSFFWLRVWMKIFAMQLSDMNSVRVTLFPCLNKAQRRIKPMITAGALLPLQPKFHHSFVHICLSVYVQVTHKIDEDKCRKAEAGDTIHQQYVLHLEDGTFVDSSFSRNAPFIFQLNRGVRTFLTSYECSTISLK